MASLLAAVIVASSMVSARAADNLLQPRGVDAKVLDFVRGDTKTSLATACIADLAVRAKTDDDETSRRSAADAAEKLYAKLPALARAEGVPVALAQEGLAYRMLPAGIIMARLGPVDLSKPDSVTGSLEEACAGLIGPAKHPSTP